MRPTVARLVFVLLALAAASPRASAQVTRIEVLSREPMAAGQAAGAAGSYEIVRGRIHGEVDVDDRRNAIIQDLALAPRNARGKVEYVATFALAKPVDLAKASRVLLYQVVNRGNGQATASAEVNQAAKSLAPASSSRSSTLRIAAPKSLEGPAQRAE